MPVLWDAEQMATQGQELFLTKVEDSPTFERLKEEWTELLAQSDSDCFFLTWEWLYSWWKHLAQSRKLCLLTVRKQGRLVAIAPLTLALFSEGRLLPFPRLEFLGTGEVGSDYLDLIIRRGEGKYVLPVLVDYLNQQPFPLFLSQLQRHRCSALQLVPPLAELGWDSFEQRTGFCPFIDLAGHSWSSYLATLGADHRYNLKRRMRQLARSFEVRFEQAECEGQRREFLATLIRLNRLRWRSRGEAFHTPELISFHDELSRLALERGWLRLFVLYLDGKSAASLYGFFYRSCFLFYQSGFDPAFSKYSVGLVSMGLAIEQALEEEANEYDLLHGDEPYKFLWAPQVRELERLELFPQGVRGRLCKRVAGLERVSRKIARRLLPSRLI